MQQLYRIASDREMKSLLIPWRLSMARYISHVFDSIHPPEEQASSSFCSSSSSSSSSCSSSSSAAADRISTAGVVVSTAGASASAPIVIDDGEHKQATEGQVPDRRTPEQQQIQQFWNGLTGKASLELGLTMKNTAGGWQQLDKLSPGAGLGETPFELGQMVRVPKNIPLVNHPGELITAIVLQTLKSKKLKVRDRLGYVRIVNRSDVRHL